MKKKEQKNQPVPGSLEALQVENKRLCMENAYLKKWLCGQLVVQIITNSTVFKIGNERNLKLAPNLYEQPKSTEGNLIFIITIQSVYKI